jgi:hypothetical protein
MDKWRVQIDSAHQIGLEIIFHGVLTVGVNGFEQGESCWTEILPADF